jgi:hypothetical protein
MYRIWYVKNQYGLTLENGYSRSAISDNEALLLTDRGGRNFDRSFHFE